MILVVGATGLLGTEICTRLRTRGLRTRALVRPGSPREAALRGLGADIVHGDLKDPASIDTACTGCSAVVTTANTMLSRRRGDSIASVDRDGTLALVAAATRAGVDRFVYTSISPVLPSNNPFVRAKRAVEAAVQTSAQSWTILQPSAFMEIHTGAIAGWDFDRGRARILGSGRACASYVSIRDVASFAVSAVADGGADRRRLHITGPEPISPLDAVAIAEKVAGRAFTVQRLPTPILELLRVTMLPFSEKLSSLMALGIGMQIDDKADMGRLYSEFAVQPTTFAEYARSAIASTPARVSTQ